MIAIIGYAVALVPLGWLGWQLSFFVVSFAALATVIVLAGLRRQAWSPRVAGWVVFPVLSGTLLGVSAADMGLAAPELAWVAMVPISAALAGGKRLATVCAIGISLGVVGMGIWGSVVPFPRSTPDGLVSMVGMVSLAGVALAGAILGQVYERAVTAALDEQRESLGRMASALRQSESRYRLALENMPVGMLQTSIDGRFLLANSSLARILGYNSVEELMASGVTAHQFYPDADTREKLLATISKEEGIYRFETEARDRQGQTLHLRVHVHGRFGSGGSLLGTEGVVEDISAEHEARQKLLHSEGRFRALVQRSSDVVAVIDQNARLTYVSPSIESLLGIAPESLLGKTVYELLHPEDAAPARQLFEGVIASGISVPATEFRLRHASGHHLFAEGVGTTMFDDPAIEGFVVNFRDVTDRKRAEAVLVHAKEQAEEVARLKSTFLANMSHEIRTPLTGILGFADILADEVTDPQQREFVELIERSGRRLLDTLNSVLDLAKLDAGAMDLGAEPVLLAEAVRETARLLEPLASEKGLTLEAVIQDEDAAAALDVGALNRILTNLVGNAIKFTRTGGVQIVVRSDSSQVALDVVDTGVGISEEFLPRLFDEFQQESSGARRTHEGSGLGLSITRQLAERMDGHVSVTSEKGRGTTFTVVFPVVAVAKPEAPTEPRRPRVLIVDDNMQTLRMASRMVESTYRVDTADGAQPAESKAYAATRESDPFDVILLDINLGTLDTGEDVMRRLRQRPPYDTCPIIAFTAYALPGDRERFIASGFDGYFAKPFTRKTLLETLADTIGEPLPETEPAPQYIVRSPSSNLPQWATSGEALGAED